MTPIGIIGLGDIALKAYLPILASRNYEIHLFTRNAERLAEAGSQYRITHLHSDFTQLVRSGIKAAFVHTATAAHESIVETLLYAGIHVYVDKPLTSDYESSKRLIELARDKGLLLTVGFNRRFAPAYAELKNLSNPNMIIMQKNRARLPGAVRTFIFDDFIHVIDTLLYLFPYPIAKTMVTGKKSGDALQHVIMQLISDEGNIAMGIMNRDTGTVEESIELFTPDEKRIVHNVTERFTHRDNVTTAIRFGDWETTLAKRGFVQMIDSFLESVKKPVIPDVHPSLMTHQLCEEVVRKLEEDRH